LRTKFTTNYFGNPRPYWNKDFDIGAYEIADAQIKIGVTGIFTPPANFGIESMSTFWERSVNGNFPVSTQSTYVSSNCTVTEADPNKENWKGWNLGWINRGVSDPNKPIAHGFYKVTGPNNSHFYLDLRDAIENYSPNIFLQYNFTLIEPKFQYYISGTFNNNDINNGDILSIWELAEDGNNNPSTDISLIIGRKL
jgi:hypothetical protein